MATLAQEVPSLARDRAFEALYRRYAKDVYHYALALLRNPADAEDVTQTTFMNAYRAFKRGEEPIKPQNWLIKIAHNVARSRYATASRRVKEVPLDQHVEQLSLPEDERPDVEAVLIALGRLPLNQRAALVLRELEGRTYAEIADTLAVSVPAVETLIFRARRALRLKASAIRALGVVPLPSSLAQLVGSGADVAAGGSALFGSSFLLKALLAIVAGGAVTGVIGTTHSKGTPAAAPAASASTKVPAKIAHLSRHQIALRTSARRGLVLGNAVDPAARPDGRDRTATSASAPTKQTTAPATSTGTGSSPTLTTNSVSAAVSTVTSAAPSLPITAPQLPVTTTVSLPPPPPLPPLP